MTDRKNAIFEAAQSLFNNKGIRGTTMSEIAKEAGMSKKTLYMLFKGKEDLVHDMYVSRLEGLGNEVSSVVEGTSNIEEKLLQYLLIIVRETINSSSQIYIDIREDYPKLDQYISEYVSESVFRRFSSLIDQARSIGAVNDNYNNDTMMMMYGNAIRNYLTSAAESSNNLPFKSDPRTLYIQNLITIFRGMLKESHLSQFNLALANNDQMKNYA